MMRASPTRLAPWRNHQAQQTYRALRHNESPSRAPPTCLPETCPRASAPTAGTSSMWPTPRLRAVYGPHAGQEGRKPTSLCVTLPSASLPIGGAWRPPMENLWARRILRSPKGAGWPCGNPLRAGRGFRNDRRTQAMGTLEGTSGTRSSRSISRPIPR